MHPNWFWFCFELVPQLIEHNVCVREQRVNGYVTRQQFVENIDEDNSVIILRNEYNRDMFRPRRHELLRVQDWNFWPFEKWRNFTDAARESIVCWDLSIISPPNITPSPPSPPSSRHMLQCHTTVVTTSVTNNHRRRNRSRSRSRSSVDDLVDWDIIPAETSGDAMVPRKQENDEQETDMSTTVFTRTTTTTTSTASLKHELFSIDKQKLRKLARLLKAREQL
jgi:hypothetical protein